MINNKFVCASAFAVIADGLTSSEASISYAASSPAGSVNLTGL